jgi:hypothetical protein
MKLVGDMPELNHLGHVENISACSTHVNMWHELNLARLHERAKGARMTTTIGLLQERPKP